MLPIGDDNSTRKTFPFVTYALIAVNVVFFLIELAGGDAFIMKWAFVPSRFLANPFSDFLSLFTSMFMHAGWVHLGGNMLYLWIFGDNVEDRFGHLKFLIFYLICGLVATFAQLIFNTTSDVPNLGASGAIAGVLGAYIILFPQGRIRVLFGTQVVQMSALIVIGIWIVLQDRKSVV
jgi:membrane associated rhomboid family serine protease